MILDPNRTRKNSIGKRLRALVVGQDEAIEQIENIYTLLEAGLAPQGRTIANILFLGPTGSGKTRTVEALAEILIGDRLFMTKVNCAEFQSDHEIAKLIGSPPGYLGHRETKPVLMQDAISAYEAKDPKVNLVLFDEIEKASPSLWNLLLGIMDKATLTLGDGKTTSFSNSIIFLTSNLGAKEMDSCLTQIGFSPHQRPDHGTEYNNRTRKIGVGAARKRFSPEFFNRLDHVIVFRPLSEKELILILELELQALQEQLRAGKSPILVDLSQDAKIHLVGLADTRYGARDLKRIIQKEITMPLSRLLTTNQARGGDIILVSLSENSKLIFHKQSFLSMPAGR